jgi:hypothetical protein
MTNHLHYRDNLTVLRDGIAREEDTRRQGALDL